MTKTLDLYTNNIKGEIMKLKKDELTTDYDTFYKWLDTCPVNSNIMKIDHDYMEIGFFAVMDEEEE